MNQPEIPNYNPGTLLTVGSHHAKVISYLTSGGFAQVYSAEIQPADAFIDSNVACLKRVIVPDKPSLNTLRAEVDAMKLLRNNKHVVSYIDSHAAKSSFPNGSYEVFLLMEYCAGGGLIDFMNTRLQNRLQEFEILNIMSQVTQGIAAMHALQPPLIHRDIKIENVLISHTGQYKVCDFGSVCGVIRPPQNPQEFAYVQHDVLKNTTAQYRSPEMIDLYRGHPIDEKSDIWALGVFLYKLCYYTTPFEKGGELAIWHSRFQFPAQPIYSDRLKGLIRRMLMENPDQRPNVCQVLEDVSRMQGIQCPVRNFYLLRAMEQQQQSTQNQLRYSRTQPVLNVPIISQPVGSPMHQISGAPLGSSTSHIVPSNSVPILAARPRSAGSNGTGRSFQTPSTSSLSAKSSQTFHRAASRSPVSTHLSTSPVRHGRGNISQIVESNRTSFDRPRYVDSVTQTSDTEEEPLKVASKSSVSLPARESHAVADKSSVVRSSSLRSKSTSSERPAVAPKQQVAVPHTKLEHIYAAKIPTGRQSLRQESEIEIPLTSVRSREAKESIQRRVRDLLNSSEDLPLSKSEPKKDEPKRGQLSKTHHDEKPSVKEKSKQKVRPRAPPKPAHLRPKPPPKPAFLSGKKMVDTEPSEAGKAVIDAKVESLERDLRKEVTGTL